MSLTYTYAAPDPEWPEVITFSFDHCLQLADDVPQNALVQGGSTVGRSIRVFRGLLQSSAPPRKVVVKTMLSKEEVDNEVAFYAHFTHLQGKHIPRLLGVYRDSQYEEYALLTEDVGEPMGLVGFLEDGPLSFKQEALHVLIQIHDAGYALVGNRNRLIPVYYHDGRAYFASFANAERRTCNRTAIRPGSLTPSRDKFMCREIHASCVSAEVWHPVEFSFYSARADVGMFDGDLWSLAELAWSLAELAPPCVDPLDAIELAYEVADFYATQCDIPDLSRHVKTLRTNGNTERYIAHACYELAAARGFRNDFNQAFVRPGADVGYFYYHLACQASQSDYTWPRLDRITGALKKLGKNSPLKIHIPRDVNMVPYTYGVPNGGRTLVEMGYSQNRISRLSDH